MPSVRDLLGMVGEALQPLSGEHGLDAVVSEVLIVGPGDEVPDVAGALVLCVGRCCRSAYVDTVAVAGFVVRGDMDVDDLDEWRNVAVPVLAANPETPWQHLVQVLSAAVAISSDRAGAVRGDLFALAESLAAMVGGAVSIEDNHRRFIAYSSVPGQVIDETRRQGILGRRTPALDRNKRVYEQLRRTRAPVAFDADGDILPRLAVAIRSGQEVLGSIWVIAASELAEGAERTLEEVSRLAAVQLLHMRGSADIERTMRSEVLRGLIDGRSTPEAAARRLGIDPNSSVVMLGFRLPDSVAVDEIQTGMVSDLVSLHCSSVQLRSTVTVQLGTVYALLPACGMPRSTLLRVSGAVVERASAALGTPVSGAIGAEVASIEDVRRTRDDVDAVLAVLRPGEVAPIEERMAQVALARIHARMFTVDRSLLPAVEQMIRYDRERGTRYCESVLAYLSGNSDIRAAAESVDVHPNTFRYRLRRADELFGVDLTKPDMRLLIWLQLRTVL